MNSKTTQPIASFAIHQDSQDSPSRILNPHYINTLPRACHAQQLQLPSNTNNVLVPSPLSKQNFRNKMIDDTMTLKDKKISQTTSSSVSGKKIHLETKFASIKQDKTQKQSILDKGFGFNDIIVHHQRRQPLQALQLDKVLMRLQKKEVINKMKSSLNIYEISRNSTIKSVGQKRSVKKPTLIKEKKQKKPFLDNDIQKSFVNKKQQNQKLSSISKNFNVKQESKTNRKNQQKIPKNIIEKNSKIANNSRKRKSPQQVQFLRQEFQKQPIWNKSILESISEETGLSISQVYKWGWDQGKKEGIQRIPDQNLHKLYSEQSDEDDYDDDEYDQNIKKENVDEKSSKIENILAVESYKNKKQNQKSRKQSVKSQNHRQKSRKSCKLPTTDQFGGYAKRHYWNESLEFACDFTEDLFYKLAQQNIVLSPNGQMGEFRTRTINNNQNKSDKEQQDYDDDDDDDDNERRGNLTQRSKKVSNELTTDILSTSRSHNQKQQDEKERIQKKKNLKKKKTPESSAKKGKKTILKRETALSNSQKKSKKQNQKNEIRLKIQNNHIQIEASLNISQFQQTNKSEQIFQKNIQIPSSEGHQTSPHFYSCNPPQIYNPNCTVYAYYPENQNPIFHHHSDPNMMNHDLILARNRSSSDDNENIDINNDDEQQQSQASNLFEEQNSLNYTPRSHHPHDPYYNDQCDYQQDFNNRPSSPYCTLQEYQNYQRNSSICTCHERNCSKGDEFNTPQFHNHTQQISMLNNQNFIHIQDPPNITRLKQISEGRRVSRVTNIANSVPTFPLNYDPAHSPPSILPGQMSAPHALYSNKYEVNSIIGSKQERDKNESHDLYWNDFFSHDPNEKRIEEQDDQQQHYFISSPNLAEIKRRDAMRKNSKFIPFSASKNRDFKVHGFLENDQNEDNIKCQKVLNLDDFDNAEGEGEEESKK